MVCLCGDECASCGKWDQVMQCDSVSKRFEPVGDASRDGRRRVSKRLGTF